MWLDLGCGYNPKEGYKGCDIDEKVCPSFIIDLRKPLPFKDNSIEKIYCSHTLEHIDRETLATVTLPEIWRICKDRAEVVIIVPHMYSQNVLNHVTFFNEDTFNNWCKEDYTSTDSYPFKFSFRKKKLFVSKDLFFKKVEIRVELEVVKKELS